MPSRQPPVPDEMQLRVNAARAIAADLIQTMPKDSTAHDCGVAIRRLSEAIEMLAKECRHG